LAKYRYSTIAFFFVLFLKNGSDDFEFILSGNCAYKGSDGYLR